MLSQAFPACFLACLLGFLLACLLEKVPQQPEHQCGTTSPTIDSPDTASRSSAAHIPTKFTRSGRGRSNPHSRWLARHLPHNARELSLGWDFAAVGLGLRRCPPVPCQLSITAALPHIAIERFLVGPSLPWLRRSSVPPTPSASSGL